MIVYSSFSLSPKTRSSETLGGSVCMMHGTCIGFSNADLLNCGLAAIPSILPQASWQVRPFDLFSPLWSFVFVYLHAICRLV